MEGRLLQSLAIDGVEIDRPLIVKINYIETATDAVSPYLIVEVDDPSGSLQNLEPGFATCTASIALDAQRARAQNSNERIEYSGTLLRWTSMPEYAARVKLFFVHSQAFALLRRSQVMMSSATPKSIISALMPSVRLYVDAQLPVLDFHALHERPVVALNRFLAEAGCALLWKRDSHLLTGIDKLSQSQVKIEFNDAGVGSPHPVYKLRHLGADYLSKEINNSEPVQYEVERGISEYSGTPNFKRTSNELYRRRSQMTIWPAIDLQSQPSLKLTAGDKFKYRSEEYITLRSGWQEMRDTASMRVLGGKYKAPGQVTQ